MNKIKVNGEKIVKWIGYVVKVGGWLLNALKLIPSFSGSTEGIKRQAEKECEDCALSFPEARKKD